MVGKLLLSLALVAIGASASLVDEGKTIRQESGSTITFTGGSSTDIIITQTTAGNGAPWAEANPHFMTPGQTHTVVVGGAAGNLYQPDTVIAAVGDIIQFNFLSKNHTLTQSTFAQPCVNAKTFDTGFIPNAAGTNPPPGMRIQVKSTAALWFYCRQKGHCGTGMVFSINPTAAKTQDMFRAAAIAQNGTASGIPPPPPAVTTIVAPDTTVATQSSPAVATGTGSVGSNGQCSCSCLCASGLQAQNPGSFGGFGGMLSPAPGK